MQRCNQVSPTIAHDATGQVAGFPLSIAGRPQRPNNRQCLRAHNACDGRQLRNRAGYVESATIAACSS